jgi:enamine deaminase RidA (YjgF/YER057c/UK114 family)
MTPEDRLASLGITLPEPMAAVANYVPTVLHGGMLYVSGQVSIGADGPLKGTLGVNLSLEQGQAAARLCGINIIAQARGALGDLSRLERIVKLGGFVAAEAGFTEIPQVVNGCSDLMVEVFGEAGRHARSAVSCPVLPLGFAVEVDAVIAVRE